VSPATLAVDAGQTQTRAALVERRGRRLATGPGVPRLEGAASPDAIANPVLHAIGELGALPGRPALGIGLSGFESLSAEELRALAERLRRELGAPRVAIASDGYTSHLGALGSRPGAVVAAGTGTVVTARNGERWAKVDAWGSLLGDAGSAYAIGRAGLDQALREHDGRGGSAALRAAAERRFGPLDELPHSVHRTASPTSTIASFSAEVSALANDGEHASLAILATAGEELATSAAAALGRVFDAADAAAVCCTGGVFAAGAPVRHAFARRLAQLWPAATLDEPLGDAITGASELVRDPDRLPPAAGLLLEES
jgi:N-acetylglucosamine kinase-like BadF-type ATPase